MHERGKFSSKVGFVLAAAGSAVGLGNIWRFPYLAANYGGMFLLTYLILVITFGFTVMLTEIAIGRKTGKSPIGAFASLNQKYRFIGWIAVAVVFIIFPYYSVIGGWVCKYLIVFLMGQNPSVEQSENFFNQYIAQPIEPMIWQILFVLATMGVVVRGVKKGIEAASRILMPLLVILTVAIAIYSVCLPGALEGVKYYLVPDLGKMNVNMILAAMGQMFYSMSLAMGIMITYGSYLRKEDDLEKSVGQIEIFDTGIAILAGFMVIPAVFAFGGKVNQGPGLMFVTLPQVFSSMPLGRVVGAAFFLLVLFAALTSSISIMEALVSTLCDQFRLSRKASSCVIAAWGILIGIAPSLGFGLWQNVKIMSMDILTFMDFITNSVLMPIGAFLTCVFVGYVIGVDTIEKEVELSSRFRRKKMYVGIVRYVAPVFILAILISSVLSAFGLLTL
ncbi:sodium-dependent transporter [Ructibacterium gallinarum]|uniref:Sodium-dependent transporter n=1 Tax=Ructibacterium gallinarum TaxID=2779355 RepID=A0A9D5R942_9FIRM|nr:sodium-dependent transporter [Ructibacterium gallinarum]MBE5040089.1 sodium-dependent transporter [Ructibacterium gallinarum]